MKMMTVLPWLIALATPALAGGVDDDDAVWPQWRGPDRNGISSETVWVSSGKPESLWSAELGRGYSTVSIADGKLYTMGYDEEGEVDVVWSLDALTGEELWAYAYPAEIWNQFHGGGTLTTPSVDGDRLYVLNREGLLHCLNAESGEVIWDRQLAEEYELQLPTWGFSASPLVLDDMVVLNVGKVIAVNKEDGETLWASEDYGHAYATPVDFEHGDRVALATFGGKGFAALDMKSGDKLYFHEWKTQYDVNAATPIVTGDKVFIASGYGHGSALLTLGEEGVEVDWENRSMKTQMSGCVLIDDHLYGFDDKVLQCMSLDGEEQWNERGMGNGAVLGTPDRLVFMNGQGELVVAQANPEKYQELSKAKVFDSQSVYWTTPVLANGVIYCRSSLGELVARDHRAED